MSLLETKSKPGQIMCVKKSKSFQQLDEENKEFGYSDSYTKIVSQSTMNDYFIPDVSEVVYVSDVYDISINVDKNLDENHQKGYIMLEFIPQIKGDKVFKEEKYQNWDHKNPYLLDIFRSVISLLKKNIAMTDLLGLLLQTYIFRRRGINESYNCMININRDKQNPVDKLIDCYVLIYLDQ